MSTCDMVGDELRIHLSSLSSDERVTLGERTPVKARMTEYIPPQWQICHVARQFKAAVAGPGVRETLEVKRVVERKDGTFDYGEWCGASAVSPLLASLDHVRKQYPRRAYGLWSQGTGYPRGSATLEY